MNISIINKTFRKLYERKLVNFILGKRLCQECAKEEWKNEDKSQSLTVLPGVCEKCHRGGMVAYIEK